MLTWVNSVIQRTHIRIPLGTEPMILPILFGPIERLWRLTCPMNVLKVGSPRFL